LKLDIAVLRRLKNTIKPDINLNCIYLLLEERKKLSTPTGGKDKRDDRTPSMKDLDLDDDSDDDDMDDIFEKARRKYHLDVDD
jgi:hypothetical protein